MTNFILAHHPQYQAKELCARLRDRRVLVRHFPIPRISNHLRISVGTREECDALIERLTELLYFSSTSKSA